MISALFGILLVSAPAGLAHDNLHSDATIRIAQEEVNRGRLRRDRDAEVETEAPDAAPSAIEELDVVEAPDEVADEVAEPAPQPEVEDRRSRRPPPRGEGRRGRGRQVEEKDFFAKHFPLSLDDLHPEIDDQKVVVWILMFFFGTYAGPLWTPAVAGADMDSDYTTEALILWLVHQAATFCTFFACGWTFIGLIIPIALSVYVYPVATLNLMNAHLEPESKGRRRRSGLAPPKRSVAIAY